MDKLLTVIILLGAGHFGWAAEKVVTPSNTATMLECSVRYMEPRRAGEWLPLQQVKYYPDDTGVPKYNRDLWSISMDFSDILRANLHNGKDYEKVGKLVPKLIELKGDPLYSKTNPIFDAEVNVWYLNGTISNVQVALGLVKDRKKYRNMSLKDRNSSFEGSGKCHRWFVSQTAMALKGNGFRLKFPNGDESDGVLEAKMDCALK